jgi:acyl dehydratase
MAMNRELIGREYRAPELYDVGREHIREFADAIGDTNPVCRSVDAAREAGHPDVVAPPTYLTVLAGRFASLSPTRDPELGLTLSRVVHGEQVFALHRPVYAGDSLLLVSRIADISDAGANERLTTAMEITAADGSLVATVTSTIISRGTASAST